MFQHILYTSKNKHSCFEKFCEILLGICLNPLCTNPLSHEPQRLSAHTCRCNREHLRPLCYCQSASYVNQRYELKRTAATFNHTHSHTQEWQQSCRWKFRLFQCICENNVRRWWAPSALTCAPSPARHTNVRSLSLSQQRCSTFRNTTICCITFTPTVAIWDLFGQNWNCTFTS